MNLRINGNRVEVTLSRRNLRTLLLKLDRPESAATLFRHCDDGLLHISAQEDDAHYQGRQPGPVHEKEEALL